MQYPGYYHIEKEEVVEEQISKGTFKLRTTIALNLVHAEIFQKHNHNFIRYILVCYLPVIFEGN